MKFMVLIFIMITLLTGCSAPVQTVSETIATEAVVEEAAVTEDTATEATVSGTNNLIHSHTKEHKYKHGDEGYYCVLSDGVEFELVSQISGTCWVCASACSMMTSYQKDHDGMIELEQMALLNEIFDDDKEEGIFVASEDKGKMGGSGIFVINELSNGFFGGDLVMDEAIDATGWSMDELKEGIRKYGALYIGIPDTNSYKGHYDGFYTMNHPNPGENEFDHSIAILGWDDNFPKEYFPVEATKNGAWITYNSNSPREYFYVSYDTPIDQKNDPSLFMSVSDSYTKVLSHDCGCWSEDPVSTGDTTTTANVFREKGTLKAVGTFVLSDDQDLTIQIMTPDLKECLYSEECHADRRGYRVFELETPMEVDEYAIAVTYPEGAPVEGESKELFDAARVDIVSEKGQSFILLEDEWLDMSEKPTWDRLGRVTNNACIKALY